MNDMIAVNNVSKRYDDGSLAVEQVSMHISKGEIYGLIGQNGAGKTTLIKMLLGMVQPTKGTCFIKGCQITRGSYHVWQHVGYMVGTPYAYPDLTVWENLHIIQKLHFITDDQVIDQVIDRLKLTKYKYMKAHKLSKGNLQRLGIAKALLHRPSILILDEPMDGLDPKGIVDIRELFYDLAENHGVTIFLSSHMLNEVEKLATTIGMIYEGRLLKQIKMKTWHKYVTKRLVITTNDNERAKYHLRAAGFTAYVKNNSIEIYDEKALQIPEEIATLLVRAGTPPSTLTVRENTLEDYFLTMTNAKDVNKG